MFDVEKKNLQVTIDSADTKIVAIKLEKAVAVKTLKKLEAIEKDLTPAPIDNGDTDQAPDVGTDSEGITE